MTDKEALYKGYWWFSDNPDSKSAGIGSIIINTMASVEVIGSLVSSKDLCSGTLNFLSGKTLLGETSKGSVTMIGVVPGVHRKNNTSAPSEGNYSSDVAIVGPRHFSTKDDVIFDSVRIEFDLLNEWIGESGITVEEDLDENSCLQERE